jgi:hypothetical protein
MKTLSRNLDFNISFKDIGLLVIKILGFRM